MSRECLTCGFLFPVDADNVAVVSFHTFIAKIHCHKKSSTRQVDIYHIQVQMTDTGKPFLLSADAPRLKIMLKAVTLANEEYKTMPTSLNKIAELAEKGKCPSTNICNLLLAFALRPEPAHEKWFSEYPPNVNLLNLFTPLTISSKEKAKAFLFVMHEYLEGPNSPNPFSDPSHPGQMPRLTILSQEAYDALGENVDTPEEIQFGIEMKAQRIQCVADLAQRKEEEERARELAGPVEQVVLPGYPPVEDDSPELPKAKLAAARKSKGKKRKVGEVAADGDASSLTDSSKAHWRRDLYSESVGQYLTCPCAQTYFLRICDRPFTSRLLPSTCPV